MNKTSRPHDQTAIELLREDPSFADEPAKLVMDDVAYKNIGKCLDGYWDKPWSELPDEQRQAWHEAIDPISDDDKMDGRQWEGRDAQNKTTIAANYDAQHDPAREGERFVAWHDYSIDAMTWLDMGNVTPKEAAMLLCRLNPHENVDPERIFVDDDESSPHRYCLLLRAFEDKASISPVFRTLMQWRSIAQERGLRYHSWIDKYVRAADVTEATSTDATAAMTGAMSSKQTGELEPWLIYDPKDPKPVQPWYTPARYFARQLVIEDSTLLTKRDSLAMKVVQSLKSVGINKRGGKKPFNSDTIKKAFSNITF